MKSKKSILTDKQKAFLFEFKKYANLASAFYLTGGTALAEYYLQHRLSEDLDFFSEIKFDLEPVYEFIKKVRSVLQARSVTTDKRNGREIFDFKFINDSLKVELVHYPYKNLKPLKKISGILISDEFDIAVNKIFAVFSRNEPKDFVDLYYLLKKFPINELLDGVEKKFDMKLGRFSLGNEFYRARNITNLPKMIKPLTHKQLADYFIEEARKLGAIIF
ncbi:hypothetical protein A2767_07155 [Candidatus Roizmanbacteria bacterium RIFCSPHIGHO2_01_FULL_35_10]|uniref:Nucleotidyl transferase AbiEii/AbiGii toxin family protein n=1 Tax=Candidatus Roizmanbacteria bacterium RIFCSPLOWO2_01_FULL_35_13 TaxID=1802055 RepID=A0A1F7ID89_9BACT|nr:MAG: hypothetical protein A2767_07155 [Candidatus Roizmanbacteria bacterium RIFCSPHIGHO2_01_FULL_35_10]OGK41333.1 MAG: hypothetical protein A3A74_03295 [Candidatus Roizmanbacteria bacterium RIFCSPLOWO2_01_FULL_35_13]